MALRSTLRFQNPDSTLDINDKIRYIVARGLLSGGSITPGTGLTVNVDVLVAQSFDGMAVFSDAVETRTVVAGQTNVVVIYAKYSSSGSPTLTFQVMDEPTYNAHPDKSYMINLGKVVLAPAAVSVLPADIVLTQRDEVDQVARSPFRGITVYASLPTPASPTNRVGDFYWVSDHLVFYFWDGSAWQALNTGSYNTETTLMNDQVVKAQRDRNVQGSGVVAGPRPGLGGFASAPDLNPTQTPSVADQMDLDSFTALINGHYVETHARTITFGAKPGSGFRYDLVFMEVWREDIVTPQSQTYDRNPDGTLTYDIDEVDDEEQQIGWVAGMAGNNWDLNELTSYDHTWRVLKYRFAVVANVPAVALYNPNDNAVVTAATNIDGVNFAAPPAGSDDRAWIATSATTPVDGRSWAIPLFVVKRLDTEDHTTNNAIKIFRSGIRHVFPVYPVCDVEHAAREAVDTVHRLEPTNHHDPNKITFDKPSGFITGLDYPIQSGGVDTIKFYEEGTKIRIRGQEDWFTLSSANISIGSPPGVGWARTLIYMEMCITLYDDDPVTKPYYMISSTNRPYIPSLIGGTIRSQGWKRGFVQYEVKVVDLGANDYRDEHDAMTSDGWTKGDVTQVTGREFDDGGLWSKSIAIDDDERIHPYLAKWAIPIVLIHRRNSSPWVFDTNPNGSGSGRPDGLISAGIINADDMVDLRRIVDLDPESYKELLESSVDDAMKGQLRTRLANKYLGPAAFLSGQVAGSRILQSDVIGNSGGAAFDLTPPDGYRKIWSDAREPHLVAVSFDATVSSSDPNLYDYTVAGNQGTLIIKSPPGSHLIRHLPGVVYAHGDSTVPADYLDFLGPPCWSTPSARFLSATEPRPAMAKYIDASNVEQLLPFWDYKNPLVTSAPFPYQPFKVTTTDTWGRATAMTGYVDLTAIPSGTIALSWWVHYDRTFITPYDVNYGLAEIPDEVYEAWQDPFGTPKQLDIGATFVSVRKTVAPGGTSVTFTSADVSANTLLPGTINLVGIDPTLSLRWSAAPPTITSVTLNDAKTTFTVNFTAWGSGGDVEANIYYFTSEVEGWVEVGRGGKSVQARWSWEQDEIDLTATPPSNYAYDIGSDIWAQTDVAGRKTGFFPQFWSRSAPATNWVLNQSVVVGHEHSNIVSFQVGSLNRYVYVSYPKLAPLSSAPADHISLHYKYTPYQGLSSDGGRSATVGTALSALKKMLHGKIEANTNFYVTQSGACSYHSGVDSWTGGSINQSNPNFSGFFAALELNPRFESYNRTFMIAPPHKVRGLVELTSNEHNERTLNAAAVLRLPFPTNFAMVNAGGYHAGVMDFDLDPGRAGASSGCWNYAPSYFGGPVNESYTKYHQFLNGLSRLAAKGEQKRQEETIILTPDMYNSDASSGASVALEFGAPYWAVTGTDVLLLQASLRNRAGALCARSMTRCNIDKPLGVGTNVGWYFLAPSISAFHPFILSTDPGYYATDSGGIMAQYTAIQNFVAGSPEKFFFCVAAGTIQLYFQRSLSNIDKHITPVITLRSVPAAADVGQIMETSVSIDNDYVLNRQGFSNASHHVDTIQIPFGSYHQGYPTHGFSVGVTSLVGKQVEYPIDWNPADLTVLDGLIQASVNLQGAGRGLYFGTTEVRWNMPVMVPGSGTELERALTVHDLLINQTRSTPERFPYMPGEPIFAGSNRHYYAYDHGGPIAYVFFGALVRPSSDDFKNQAVLQISGGPTGTYNGDTLGQTVNDLDGTAIDAFWPKWRPLLPTRD